MAQGKRGTQYTSGRVVYSRKVQPAQYESEGVEVELAFVVEEGVVVDDAIDDALALAKKSAEAAIGPGRRRVVRSGGRFSSES